MINNKVQIGISTSPVIIYTEDNMYRCYKNNKDRYLVFDSDGNNLGWKDFEQLENLNKGM